MSPLSRDEELADSSARAERAEERARTAQLEATQAQAALNEVRDNSRNPSKEKIHTHAHHPRAFLKIDSTSSSVFQCGWSGCLLQFQGISDRRDAC